MSMSVLETLAEGQPSDQEILSEGQAFGHENLDDQGDEVVNNVLQECRPPVGAAPPEVTRVVELAVGVVEPRCPALARVDPNDPNSALTVCNKRLPEDMRESAASQEGGYMCMVCLSAVFCSRKCGYIMGHPFSAAACRVSSRWAKRKSEESGKSKESVVID